VSGEQAGALENRFSFGAAYTLFEQASLVCTLMTEFRQSHYENAPGADDNLNEFFARVALAF
jgi:hypothetical protein